MSFLHASVLAGASGNQGPYQIEQSLRFNSADSAYLNRTPGSAGNRKTWTWSGWFKRSDVSASTGNFTVFAAQQPSGSDQDGLIIDADGSFYILFYSSDPGGSNLFYYRSDRQLRDPSAWYHIMFVLDTTQSAVDDRCNVWINNEKVVDINTANRSTLAQNFEAAINNTGSHTIGKSVQTSDPGDGYLAEVNFIDGTAYTDATAFGEYDNNGVWRPIKYAGSYTGQSWYLKFASGDGTDSSGLSNDWTANNFTPSGTGTDVMSDTPTTNWCTLNSAANSPGTRTLSNGNLQADLTAAAGAKAVGTFLIPISGKWYWEMTVNDSNSNQDTGVIQADSNFQIRDNTEFACYFPNGEYKIETAAQTSGFSTYTNGDIISIAVDADTNPPEIYFAKNNTWQNSAAPASGTNGLELTVGKRYLPLLSHGSGGSSSSGIFNFGQRDFAYTPPTGYKALNTANLPAPDIADGSDYFNTVLYTGTNATNAITGVGFAPNFVWVKRRSASGDHILSDSVRTAGKYLSSNLTASEVTSTDFGSFDSDGFTVNAVDQTGGLNSNGNTYAAWNWLAANGTEALTTGSINSTVSANPSAGFSIVSYTGTGSAGATVGHGLGVEPSMIIIKNRDDSASSFWCVYHKSAYVSGADPNVLYLNSTQAQTDDTNVWGSSPDFNSTTFELGDYNGSNGSGDDLIAYCFAEVEGYSKFGSYVGQGDNDTAPFIYTGHKPAWILVKRATGTGDWTIYDVKRDTYNPASKDLVPNSATSEPSVGMIGDILSNGFKIRNQQNVAGQTYIYASFASHPFGGDGVSPATAR